MSTIRIKMLCDWCYPYDLCKQWSLMCEDGFRWKNLELTWEDENIDYYVIINKPNFGINFVPKKTIIYHMEPWVHDGSKPWGVKTWGGWANPDPSNFLHVNVHRNFLNLVQWDINPPEIFPEERKNKAIAIISEKKFYDGHIKRVNLVYHIESKNCDLIDIYGRENHHGFKNYIGTTDKSHYKDYKYCYAVENNAEHNYATEKIWEPILHEMLCFYWGCPNLDDYIDSQAFVKLDMSDFDKSAAIIKQAIEEDWWSQRIGAIREAKKKILEELGFFPNLAKIIEESK